MTYGDIVVIAVLGLIVGFVIAGMIRDKKSGKKGCTGCPNYGSCRAHLGCSNNSNHRE